MHIAGQPGPDERKALRHIVEEGERLEVDRREWLLVPTTDKLIHILVAFEAEAEDRENDLRDEADEGKEDDRDNDWEQDNESGFEISAPPKGAAKSYEAIAKARYRRVFRNEEAWAFRMEQGAA